MFFFFFAVLTYLSSDIESGWELMQIPFSYVVFIHIIHRQSHSQNAREHPVSLMPLWNRNIPDNFCFLKINQQLTPQRYITELVYLENHSVLQWIVKSDVHCYNPDVMPSNLRRRNVRTDIVVTRLYAK